MLHSPPPRLRHFFLSAILVGVVACGGGGGGDTTGPAKVARVEVTGPTTQLEVGMNMNLSVAYFDAKNNPLSGRTVTYRSQNASLATVDNNGFVTGVAAGQVSLTATVEGVSGSIALTVIPPKVQSVMIAERTPVVTQGSSITLTAQAQDASARPIAGRTITWSSADPSRATVNGTGVVTGVAPGNAFIHAESEGVKDSVRLKVKSLTPPAITGGTAALSPGATATIVGQNFAATPAENEVYVNGVRADVSAATSTSLTFTVPAATALPCVPNGGNVPLIVAVNSDSATATRQLHMATTRSLAVGESLILTNPADLQCTEYTGTGGRYLITAFNYAPTPVNRASFQVVGASNATPTLADIARAQALQQASAEAHRTLQQASQLMHANPMLERHYSAHREHLARENDFWMRQGSPAPRARAMRAAAARAGAAQVAPPKAPPNVGDMASVRMRKSFEGSYEDYDEVRVRAVYVGAKFIIYEDSLAPLAGTMDAEYARIGQEFDQVMYPFLERFGRPLAADTDLAWNGKIIAVFSARVNAYRNGQILGFVTACDFFPPTMPISAGGCPSSNFGEYFYALVPDPNNANASRRVSMDLWRRVVRGTLIHEAKHLTSVSERYVHDASRPFDEIWLEEATAQQASELWARALYQKPQKSDIAWQDGPRCDYWPQPDATCADPAEAILHHFAFLYSHYLSHERKSILSDPTGFLAPDPVVYGSSWSFARYVTDLQPDESAFLRSITQVKNDAGVANLVGKAGRTFAELLGKWSLASLADNYPQGVINDSELRLQSWNTRDVFAGMNRTLVTGNPPRPAYPQAFPLLARQVTFTTWSDFQRQVTNLQGGGFVAWELSGTQTAPQVIALRALNGSAPPSGIGLAILRVQ